MADPDLSVLFLTYNRADILLTTYAAMREALARIPDLTCEYIVADDNSAPEHRRLLGQLEGARIMSSERNGGLSHNHNKGMAACAAPLILSLQDDFLFTGAPELIAQAVDILRSDPEVGDVNFVSHPVPLPSEQRRTPAGVGYIVFENDLMGVPRATSDRPYSDRPHLKRKAFAADVGPYREDLPMTKAELDYQMRVACQTRWRVAYLAGCDGFEHVGADRSFNPAQLRHQRIERLEALPIVGPVFAFARRTAKAAAHALGIRR